MFLKKLFRILLGVQFLLGVGLAVLTALLYLNQEKLSKCLDTHFQSYLLADELRQSSDDLSRLARTYVATGNDKYEHEYWAVLGIRNGKSPRPIAYNRIYWDFISGTGQKPRPDGVAISLRELMTKEGFASAALQKLALSQKYSDELVKTEMIAMNAVKGLFDDGTGKFTIKKKPDRALATQLLNDEVYHKHKVNIMKPIDEFYAMFAESIAGDVTKYEQHSMNLLLSLGVLIIVIMTMFVYSFLIFTRQLKERKQADSTLRASERKYRTLIEQMPDMTWQKDIHGAYVSCNSNYADVLGVTVESIAGHRDEDFYKPELVAKYLADDQSVITIGQPLETEELWEEAKKERWIHTSKVPLLDEDGNVIGTIGIARDITERKQAEKVLRENEERLRTILKTAQDGLWLVDASTGQLADVNEAAASMLGYTREELLNRGLVDIDVQWSPEELHREMQKVKESENAFFETRHCTKGGQTIYVEVSVNYLPANDQFFAFIHNITDRKRAENELKNALLFNKHIIDSAQEGIMVYDSELRYLSFNPFMEKLTGLKASDVIGKTPSDLFPFMEESGVVGDLKKVLRGENVKPREFQDKIPKLGRNGWVIQTNAPLLNTKGEIIGILGMVRDITEQKKTIEQLQQAQKMESVGRLAGGVAHDFNNMLGVIIGYAEIAMEKVDTGQPLHSNLQEIRNAANRSADLTRQLLAFARKQVVSPKVLDINETVDGMLKMLLRLIGEDIDLAWLPGVDVWPVKVDPSQIDQILVNLCINARDAITGVGKLTIETENISFDEAYCADCANFVPGEYVLLTVSDNGSGMDKKTIDKIFEPFFTTKGVGKGTGLGLATVYGIVKQNNGFINVCSEPRNGATFKIYLPRHAGVTEEKRMEAGAAPLKGGQETILVVEDELVLLELNKFILERQGYQVLTAGTPGEAIRLAKEYTGEIHLLMTDVVMPEMNGQDLSRKMLSRSPHLKCLFTSGYTADVIAHQGVLNKGVHFIQKPFSRKDLAAKVREVLDQL